MAGRVCVITGASSGIGQAAAVALARLGASMVLVCRDRGRGERTMAEVAAAATAGQPSLELADLSSFQQVRDVAGRLGQLPKIDVLINNAGLVVARRRLTVDGIEHTLAVNHLAPFLLTNLLLPKLQASAGASAPAGTGTSAPARVITVSSTAHRGARLNLDDLQLERFYSAMLAYSNSKTANILFTRELARRLAGTGVTANCLHPGTVATNFGQTGSRWLKYGLMVGRYFLRTPESGASRIVYLASSPEVAGQTGGYYVGHKCRQPSKTARDDDLARRLWDLSAELTASTGPVAPPD